MVDSQFDGFAGHGNSFRLGVTLGDDFGQGWDGDRVAAFFLRLENDSVGSLGRGGSLTRRAELAKWPSMPHRLDDLLGHLLGVAEQHHCIVAVEQGVVDTGIA